MVQEKRNLLRQHLQRMGFRDAYIDVAIERSNIDAESVTTATAFTWCCEFIKRELDPPAKPPQPLSQAPLTTSWKAKVAAPALDIRAELKRMGYTDQQVDSAVTRGCSDLKACLQYLLSAESSYKASSHAPAPAPSTSGGGGAATSSIVVISSNERQLVNMDCALFNPSPPSTATLTRVQEYKGWLYKTAHERRVDQMAHVQDGLMLADVPFGWDLCFLDPDVRHICKAFGWSSHALVLADGSVCFTAACITTFGCNPGS